ncbi:hypothetical protein I6A84_19625 [Frankia sp. CNm7]|uniref:Uncharacterized protein n=1 Tax=Frankia nepalensis TaxID=1836974 RepID=A0A937REZ8_9ACTN|nr:hypothetical protein [Frankia nepalensis]MBL7496301.1 hypothetical protein [Frankia nepalensis]MBL7508502.1 hypothetical protein [Frankia nepalensis]MBL7520235.1 hypothetical protein [Frankia nepalensis]MBL7627634.1 hypothetical protein [Frankia nepalensis]
MSLVGARPKGPRADLKDGPQKVLLTRLNELNNPYRVSYEMVSRQLWSDQGPTKIQRSRSRDLSRQFRGEKAIEWRVVEIYVNLLFDATDPALAAELTSLRALHAQAFETTIDPDGTPSPGPAPSPEPTAAPVDPAYVAELERQLEEARTRAAFATALLVIVQAENTALRGRGSSFGWFSPAPRAGDNAAEAAEAGSRPRTGKRAAAKPATTADHHAAGRPAGGRTRGARSGTGAPADASSPATPPAASSTPATGRRDPRPHSDADASRPIDPATTPIVRRQGHRGAPRRRPVSNRPAMADAFPPAGRAPAYPAVAPPAPSSTPAPSTLAALARSRSASGSPRRAPTSEPLADDSGLDVLVSGERRRRGKDG